MEIDWDNCSDIEIKPDVMSGAPVIRGTRVTAQAVLDNADDGYTAEEIVADIYPSLPVELTRRVIEFARRAHASAPAGRKRSGRPEAAAPTIEALVGFFPLVQE